MSFTLHREINGKNNPCYSKLKKTRLIHIDGFGYFTIVSDDENFEDKIPNKNITAYSAEYLLNNKGINLTFVTTAGSINDSSSTTVVTSNYFFYSETQPEKSLLNQLIKAAPQWKLGYISGSLRSKSRSFSQTDKGLYGFLTNEVSQSYEALFVFDNENYIINAYDTTEVVKNTNIVISFDNLLKNAKVSELSDDIYTVINVSGAENLSIAKINPNGTKKLFCLDYYTGVLDKTATNYYENYNEWITDNNLKRKVLEWEKANKEAIYDKSATSYGGWTSLQKKFNLLLLTQQAALNQMQSFFDTAQQNMSLYTDYSDIDKLKVYVKKKNDPVTFGDAKKNKWQITNYYEVDEYTLFATTSGTGTDADRITKYAYWKAYSQACEANLKILKEGGKLYLVRKSDFESTDGSYEEPSDKNPNLDYTIPTSKLPQANGDSISDKVSNHSITPSGTYAKYSINALTQEIADIQKERDKIVAKYAYNTYFTDSEKLALDPFIIEGSFSDDSFIVTDSMETKDYSDTSTKVEVVQADGTMVVKTIEELKQTDVIMDDIYVAGQLVDAGYEKLKVVSQPSFSFEAESTNFFFIEKFKPFINQLTSIEKSRGSLFGCILNIQLEDDNWVYPYLQELEINYDDPDSFTMRFGNRFRLSNDAYTFNELHNETTSAVSSVGSLLSAISQPVTNGTIDAVTEYTKSALIAANQSIKATTDNEFTFGSYGIKGRKKSSADGNINGFAPEQLWMSNNKICFTDDGWKTTKAVFGKTTVNGVSSYGLIADTIVGKLIMGNSLEIANSANTMTFNENGLIVKNSAVSVTIGPNAVIDVVKTTGAGNVNVFNVDKNGNLTITGGKIVVGDGKMGYVIDGANGTMTSIAKDSNGAPLFSLSRDGHLSASGLALSGQEVTPPSTDPITPSGSDGIVNDAGTGFSGMDFFAALRALIDFFWFGPYVGILNLVGRRDSEGWRKIWGYYSKRSLQTILDDFAAAKSTLITERNISGTITPVVTQIVNEKADNLSQTFISRTELNDYKKWNDTKEYLESNYQTKTNMQDYYTSQQIDNFGFVKNSSLTQNYYSKSEIDGKFETTNTDILTWKTITVNNEQITVLTKTTT